MVAAFAILVGRRIVRHVAVLVLLGTHLALGIWTIRILPQPWPMIDVYMFQRDSVAALLAGVDPYAITFPNPYPTGAYYGPGMVVDGRLTFGFVYPPLSVFLSVLGEWIGGDVRYAQLGAMTLAAAFMAYTRRGPARRARGRAVPVHPAEPVRAGAELDRAVRRAVPRGDGVVRGAAPARRPVRAGVVPRREAVRGAGAAARAAGRAAADDVRGVPPDRRCPRSSWPPS